MRGLLIACLLIGSLVGVTSTPFASRSPSNFMAPTRLATKECTVWVTRTGAKYHQSECGYLRQSRRPMKRAVAVAAGYEPCKRCGGSNCE